MIYFCNFFIRLKKICYILSMKRKRSGCLAAFICCLVTNSFFYTKTYSESIPKSTPSPLKTSLTQKYSGHSPKQWGEAVSGVKTHVKGNEKIIALTFDACGSTRGMGFDRKITDYLEKERIPATLFINGRWIEQNRKEFQRLAATPLFEIANHGQNHKPASVNGKSVYGISGTGDVGELVDEIELNAGKIETLTGKRPRFYRSGTAYYDEIAVKIAQDLHHDVAGFSLLGDAGATYSREQVKNALLHAKPGDIAILHFNHPGSGTADGLIDALPILRKRGFRFVRLSDVELE
jgi:peptidoglycan/xylan/chitin deacetylase (PgdA/CDA1 family)